MRVSVNARAVWFNISSSDARRCQVQILVLFMKRHQPLPTIFVSKTHKGPPHQPIWEAYTEKPVERRYHAKTKKDAKDGLAREILEVLKQMHATTTEQPTESLTLHVNAILNEVLTHPNETKEDVAIPILPPPTPTPTPEVAPVASPSSTIDVLCLDDPNHDQKQEEVGAVGPHSLMHMSEEMAAYGADVTPENAIRLFNEHFMFIGLARPPFTETKSGPAHKCT